MEKVSNDTGVSCEFLNALEETELRTEFNVVSVPFTIFYVNGKVVFTYDGIMSEKQVLSLINKYNS